MTPENMAVAFGRVLRGAGITVPLDSILTFVQCLGVVGVTEREAVYWAGRGSLVRRPEDLDLYDKAFRAFWEGDHRGLDDRNAPVQRPQTLAVDIDDDSDGTGSRRSDREQTTLRFSALETLRRKDFAEYTADELRDSRKLMSRLRFAGPPRRALRLERTSGRTRHTDVRRTVRATLRHHGEPVRRLHRKPAQRLRRLVVLLDISGSMEPYARALLQFMHSAVVGRQRVETFTLGTRLTRVTRELSSRDPDRALNRASGRVEDWSGGTRLGETLRQFNDRWGVRGMARGAIVVILSDGWDRGDPSVLAEQMQRLGRVAHRVVWVNPLKAGPGYAPLARGMAAALPHVDAFVEGHSVDALERLAMVMSAES